jgi:hypothetical protein
MLAIEQKPVTSTGMNTVPATFTPLADLSGPTYDRNVSTLLSTLIRKDVAGNATGFLSRRPTEDERRALQERAVSLRSYLKRPNKEKVRVAISEMLLCYSKYQTIKADKNAEESFKEIVSKFVQELQDVPQFAILRACQAIRMGQASGISLEYPPSTMQVRACAMVYASSLFTEIRHVHAALTGEEETKPISPEERERVRQGLLELSARLGASVAADEAAQAEQRKKDSGYQDHFPATAQGLREMVGEEAWNAIPNASTYPHQNFRPLVK